MDISRKSVFIAKLSKQLKIDREAWHFRIRSRKEQNWFCGIFGAGDRRDIAYYKRYGF